MAITHRLSKTRFYEIYLNLNRRCNEKTNNRYYRYGARGIKCEWKCFEEFRDDMYKSYLEHYEKYGKKNTTIDRINSNGNYCKENCRWANLIEQARTRSSTVLIEINGESKSMREWARIYNKPYTTIFNRIKYAKLDPIVALEKPNK